MKAKKPLWIGYKLYVLFVFFGSLIPFYPIFRYLLADEKRWPTCFKWQIRWGKVVRSLTGLKMNISGMENLPPPPYIVVANHASYIDTFLMYGIIPDYFVFMGMAELSSWPMFRWFFKSGQNIPVNRSSIRASVKAFEMAEQKIDRGDVVALFPEGGIKPDVPELSVFKNGAFKLALKKKVPIVPILLFDTHILLESNNVLHTVGRPGTANVKILNSVSTFPLTEEDLIPLRQQIWEDMNGALQEYYQKD